MEKDNQGHFTSTGCLQSRSLPELNNAKSLVDQGNSNTSTEINPHNTKTKRKYTVMIVDDEAEVALTYESFLTSTGCYSVKAFTEPYLALLDFANKRNYYDLAILDGRMPDINGLQLYQSLNAMNPSCKFIFVSSLDAVEELLSIFPGIGKSNIFRKPIEKKKFLGIVNLILG